MLRCFIHSTFFRAQVTLASANLQLNGRMKDSNNQQYKNISTTKKVSELHRAPLEEGCCGWVGPRFALSIRPGPTLAGRMTADDPVRSRPMPPGYAHEPPDVGTRSRPGVAAGFL